MRGHVVPCVLAVGLVSADASAGSSQASFTPSGYEYPIMVIELSKADGTEAQALYTCPNATPDACMVDLADDTALATITAAAQGVAIKEGTYERLELWACLPGTPGTETHTVSVTGSVAVDATTFVTSDSAPSGMSDSGAEEPADITIGCGGATINLLEPVVVTADSEQTLNLVIDLTNLVWTDANASPGMGGCRADPEADGGQDLCTGIPRAVPYVGSGTASFERYLIAHHASDPMPPEADANAIVALAVDENGDVFHVIVEPYFSATSPAWDDPDRAGPDYNTEVRAIGTNDDGSIQFQTGADAQDDRVGFSAFLRETHTGTCKDELATSPVWNYQAFAQ